MGWGGPPVHSQAVVLGNVAPQASESRAMAAVGRRGSSHKDSLARRPRANARGSRGLVLCCALSVGRPRALGEASAAAVTRSAALRLRHIPDALRTCAAACRREASFVSASLAPLDEGGRHRADLGRTLSLLVPFQQTPPGVVMPAALSRPIIAETLEIPESYRTVAR